MASIQKRKHLDGTTVYRVQIRKKGLQDINASFSTLKEAEEWAEETEGSLKNATVKFKMKDMFSRYKLEWIQKKTIEQRRDEESHLMYWEEYFSDQLISMVKPEEIEIIANKIYEKKSRKTGNPLTPESRRKYLMTLSYIFNVACCEWRWIDSNPVLYVNKHKKSLEERRQKVISKAGIGDLKEQFIEKVTKELELKGALSINQMTREVNMPHETIRRLLNVEENSQLSSMKQLTDALGLKLTITVS